VPKMRQTDDVREASSIENPNAPCKFADIPKEQWLSGSEIQMLSILQVMTFGTDILVSEPPKITQPALLDWLGTQLGVAYAASEVASADVRHSFWVTSQGHHGVCLPSSTGNLSRFNSFFQCLLYSNPRKDRKANHHQISADLHVLFFWGGMTLNGKIDQPTSTH
jgi:hypothetical protein